MDMKIGRKRDQQSSALWNRRLTLQLLRRHGRLSRRQLAEMTELRGSTLTYIVRDLTEQGIVRQAGKRESDTVGQKQILLEIDADAGWTLGLDLRKEEAQLVIQDAAGHTVDDHLVPMRQDLLDVPKVLKKKVSRFLEAKGRPAGECLGMGVGVPGVVDHRQGLVVISRDFDCTDVPLGKLFQEQFEVPVLIDNNANLATLAEARVGAGVELSSFVYFLIHHIKLGDDIIFNKAYGCGLYLDGKLHRGFHYAAGEIDDSLQPSSEDFCMAKSEIEVLAQATNRISENAKKFARMLGGTVAHLINLIDPKAVVIGAAFPLENREFLDEIRKSAALEVIPIHHRQVSIVPDALGHLAIAFGAATAAAENAFFDKSI